MYNKSVIYGLILIFSAFIFSKSILDIFKFTEKQNIQVSYLNVKDNGILDLNYLKSKINSNTKLVSIMMANNEIEYQSLADLIRSRQMSLSQIRNRLLGDREFALWYKNKYNDNAFSYATKDYDRP